MITRLVTTDELEHELKLAQTLAQGSREGMFGPESMEWRINGEAAVFLGAGRALLLQLAHPFVAAAVQDRSRVFAHPIRRFHRTFQVVFSLVFGTLEQAVAAARQLHQRHASIRGALPEAAGPFAKGTPYYANDLESLRWVHATLVETALLAHDLMLPALTESGRERYYTESCLLAALFGIPRKLLPPDWNAFIAYNATMHDSGILSVSTAARTVAHQIIRGAGNISMPNWYWALTEQMLPTRLREGFGLNYGESVARSAKIAVARLKRLYPRLPWRLRHVGPFQEAHARLCGRVQTDFTTQLFNWLWIGQRSLSGRPALPSHNGEELRLSRLASQQGGSMSVRDGSPNEAP